MKYTRKDRETRNYKQGIKGSHRWLMVVAVAAILLAVGVVTAVSRQGRGVQELKAQKGGAAMTEPNPNYVTSNAAGQTVVVNRQTGETRPLTPEEAKRLAEGLKQMLNQSTEGLIQIRHANGSVSMDLQGHFQNVMLAKKDEDGNVTTACVDNVDSAAAFFELDPALLGSTKPAGNAPSSLNPIR